MPYGLLYFYESGTNDDKDTFADVNETIKNSQPLILNGDGSVPNCFYSGTAKVKLLTNAGTPTTPIDGTQQWERDPVSSGSVGAVGREWDAISIYDANSIVTFNSLFYVSIINSNQNNNPSSTPSAWTQWDLLKRWNTNETYNVRDPVIATDFTLYISQVGSNLGNDPISSPSEWLPSGAGSGGSFAFAGWDLSIDYPVGGSAIVTGSDGNYYKSIQTPNLNNDPVTPSPTFWEEVTFIEGGNITIEGGTIASTVTDSDINITPDGTGTLTLNGSQVLAADISTNITGTLEWQNSTPINLGNNIDLSMLSNGVGGVVFNLGDAIDLFLQDNGTTRAKYDSTTNQFDFPATVNFTNTVERDGVKTIPAVALGRFTSGGTSIYKEGITSVTDGGNNLGNYRDLTITLSDALSSTAVVSVSLNGTGDIAQALIVGLISHTSTTVIVVPVIYAAAGTLPDFADLNFTITIFDMGR